MGECHGVDVVLVLLLDLLDLRRELLKSGAACVIAGVPFAAAAQSGQGGAKVSPSAGGAAPGQAAGPTPILVLNSLDASVSVIDPVNWKEVKRLATGKEPHHLMATPDGQSLIVANAAGNDLVFLNPVTGEIQRRVKNIPDPYQIGYSPDKKWFVAAGNRLHRIDIYAASNNGQDLKLVKAVPAPKTPSHIAFSADSAVSRYSAPESSKAKPRVWATRLATVPLPDAVGPSIVMTGTGWPDMVTGDRSWRRWQRSRNNRGRSLPRTSDR